MQKHKVRGTFQHVDNFFHCGSVSGWDLTLGGVLVDPISPKKKKKKCIFFSDENKAIFEH